MQQVHGTSKMLLQKFNMHFMLIIQRNWACISAQIYYKLGSTDNYK